MNLTKIYFALRFHFWPKMLSFSSIFQIVKILFFTELLILVCPINLYGTKFDFINELIVCCGFKPEAAEW